MTPGSDFPRERLLALALLAGFITLLCLGLGISLVSAFSEQSARLEYAAKRLAAYEVRRDQIPLLEKHLAGIKTQDASSSGLLTDRTAPLAAASIQSRLRPLLNRHGAEIRSIQNLPVIEEDGFEKTAVQYVFSLPESGLRDVLYAVETATPYLFLDEVSIRRPENVSEISGVLPPLDIRWTVTGYRWVGGQ